MKFHKIAFLTLPLLVAACSESTDQQATTSADKSTEAAGSESPLTEQAKTWTDETKKLGQAAWDSTKDAASDAADKSKEYYETAKDKTAEMVESTKDKTSEMYQSAKDKGGEVMTATKDKAGEIYDASKEKATELYNAGKDKAGIGSDASAAPVTERSADKGMTDMATEKVAETAQAAGEQATLPDAMPKPGE